MHKRLAKQLAKATRASGEVDVAALTELLSAAYEDADRDRRHTDRSIASMIAELEVRHLDLQQRDAQFNTAIRNISQGLIMFDVAQRLVVCNSRYLEMYGLSAEVVKPGCTFRDLIHHRFETGSLREDPEPYLKKILDPIAEGRVTRAVTETSGGRQIAIVTRPLPGGGWVTTHEDITPQWRAEQAAIEARARAESAEREAKDAHRYLLDAFAVVPEGLALYDAEDRLLLWNQRYAELYPTTKDILRSGLPFEELIRTGIERGQYPEAIGREDEWLADRLARHARAESHEQQLPDGRWVRVVERRTDDGGSIGVRIDITNLKQREEELRRTRAFLDTVIENVPAAVIVKNSHDFRIVLVNRAGEAFLGLPRDQIIGRTSGDLLPKSSADLILAQEKRLLDCPQQILVEEHPMETPVNGTRLVSAKRLVIRGADQKPQYLLGVIEDITERKHAEDRIKHLARHDALTGLPNRATFNERFALTLERAARTGESFAVMCIDLDRFKEVNDVFGHQMGDDLLVELSRRLRAAAASDFLARVGGDEFTIIATGPQPSTAESIGDCLLGAVAGDAEISGHPLRISLSVGVAVYPSDGTEAATLLGNADAALYRAKAAGRATIRFFAVAMDQQLRERRSLQHDLHLAIARGELSVHFQPIARIDREVVGFEALVRWHHPQHGLVPPGTFIPLAEESGLIIPMGEWILRQACREATGWAQPLQLAVNLSPVQFRHGDLPATVHTILLETGLAANRLELEITEGVLISDFSRAITILRRLKSLGVRISMDDFGTGYSSLSYLRSFPFDKLKIDQVFMANVERDPQSAAIVRAIISLGHALGLTLVAEGVETEEQLAFIAQERVDQVQGYLIGRPLPIENYADLTAGAKPGGRDVRRHDAGSHRSRNRRQMPRHRG